MTPIDLKNETDIYASPLAKECARLAYIFDPDPSHALHVAKLAVRIFDLTLDDHCLNDRCRELLMAAACLHDIGRAHGKKAHHKSTFKMIQGIQLPMASDIEKTIISCIARYHRRSHPSPEHQGYCDLDSCRQQWIWNLGGILRVADCLDKSHLRYIIHLDLIRDERKHQLIAYSCSDLLAEKENFPKKKRLYEEAFGLVLELVVKRPELIK